MLVELNICYKARHRGNGLFEIRPFINGKHRSIYGRTAEELARKYRLALKDVTGGERPARLTLFAWLDEWLTVYKKPNLAERSFDNNRRCVEKHIKPHLLDKPLNRYTPAELTKALNEIESTRMRKYARGILREAFGRAVGDNLIRISPAQNLAQVKHFVKRGHAIPLQELLEMIRTSRDVLAEPSLLYLLFCLFSGARRDEAVNLTLRDCDFVSKIIHFRGTKTESSDRLVPMFPILEKILIKASAGRGEREKVFGIGQHRADDSFATFRGKNDEAVLHWLRHTFGTVQVCVLGVPVVTVSQWLGHSDTSTTMNIYTHPEQLAPDIYYSGRYTEDEKRQILTARYNSIISEVEKIL
ncbi:MAG: site-specific integrase [Clostridia bacterium]|nr:site-specific integrase [Clostridia bacterium]